MGFCTAKHIDLLNMTNGRRSASAKVAKKCDALAAGEQAVKRALSGPQTDRSVIPGVGGEEVAFVAYRLNPVGFGGVVEQFFAQARDSDVNAAIHPVVGDAA